MYIVYETTNIVNNKIYVGVHKTNNIDVFDGYLGSGSALYSAIKKYGNNKFIRKTLFIFDTSEEAYSKESDLVDEYFVKRNDTYNICTGGLGPGAVSEQTKIKISESLKGIKKAPFSVATKQKMSESARKRKHSKATKEKIAKASLGRKHSEETKKIISKKKKGIPISEDHKRNISLSQKGKKKSPRTKEHSDNLSKALKGRKFEIVRCPHCGKEGNKPLMKRWHFDNCKLIPNGNI